MPHMTFMTDWLNKPKDIHMEVLQKSAIFDAGMPRK